MNTGGLLQDTICRRTRAAIARALHAADAGVGRLTRSRVRVLFEAASPLSLAVFRPVLDRLRGDDRLDFWYMSADAAWDATRIFQPVGLADRVVSARQARWMQFDAYINTDFWNMTWLPRAARRVHLFHGVAGKYGLDAPVAIAPLVASFDRLMFPNRDRLERYVDAGLVARGPQAPLVGYPKVDCLVDGSLDRSAIQAELGLDPSRPTVLYAPTWSADSSLNTVGLALIAALSRLDANVIVKLHDRSYDRDTRASGGIDWRRLDAVCGAWRAHVAHAGDASPYLFASDVLVTDHSSVGFEYALLDRPIVVVDTPALLQTAGVPPSKSAWLRSAATVVDGPDAAARAVSSALADPSAGSSERRALADRFFHQPGTATARALACIYDLLELPIPVHPPASTATARAIQHHV
jgi:hypothetical protein